MLATAAFVDFDAIRIRLVREPLPVQEGVARIDIRDERGARLQSPFALIVRIRNDAPETQRFSIRLNARAVCEAEVTAASARRVDCAVSDWDRQPNGELVIEPASRHPWAIEYLELATHHGRSTGWLDALVLPRDAVHLFTRPPRTWAMLAGLTIAALLLLPSPGIANRRLRLSHAVASGVAMVPFVAVVVAPVISPYRIVLSTSTFAAWLAIPFLPRLWSMAIWLWLQLPIAAQTAMAAMPRLAFGTPWKLACWLGSSLTAFSVAYGARVVGAADEYGYLSQADLWLQGRLLVDQAFVRDMPWPGARWWFTPLAYLPHRSIIDAIVPVYSPGLPMMLALAKFIGGQDAAFFVVPLCGGLLVLATYAVGRRVGSGIAPLVAAWLVATSPLVLGYSLSTMSDVPVAAAWTGAFYLLCGTSTASAAGAGLLSGVAVLIRPNLAPLVPVLGLLYLLRVRESGRRALTHLVVFGMAAAPAALAVAVINAYLYGSPLASGYGSLRLFDPARVIPNLRNYLAWLVEVHTPVVVLGLAAIALPVHRLWPGARERAGLIVIGVFVAALWVIYCLWMVFDTWWFTRFLLPSLPFMMLGIGACADAVFRATSRWIRAAVVAAIVALGITQLQLASTHAVFTVGHGMRRYAAAAALARQLTEPNSVIVALNHSGSLRYYGGRITINIGNIESGGPIDEVLDWLQRNGVQTYATFEDWEVKEISPRFAGTKYQAALNRPPLAIVKDPGQLMLFDLSDSRTAPREPIVVTGINVGWRAVQPGPPPRLVLSREK
jgi:4-amino-4-deoxy-L-arabinose transferase-like glycosyltransferase